MQAEHVAEHTELLQLRVQATADHRELLQLRTQVPADRQELLQLRAQVSALRADLRVFSDAEEHLKAQDVDLYSPGVCTSSSPWRATHRWRTTAGGGGLETS